jgi:hypothetical protein
MTLVVVHDFDIVRSVNSPDEVDAIAIVNPDAVLSGAISLQSLEAIPLLL